MNIKLEKKFKIPWNEQIKCLYTWLTWLFYYLNHQSY